MRSILIVDDDEWSRDLLLEYMKISELEAVAVKSAEEAFDFIKRTIPSLVLMDIRLPGMDGATAIKRLKEEPLTSKMPVIATTAHAMSGDVNRFFEAGCDAYMAKPVNLPELLQKIKDLLNCKTRLG